MSPFLPERSSKHEEHGRHWPARRPSGLRRPGGRFVGIGHGPADPHRRLRLVDGSGREGRHRPGMTGVDLCCCTGRGHAVSGPLPQRRANARRRCHRDRRRAGHAPLRGRRARRPDRLHARPTSATRGLPDAGSADFVWGEDAWCYVVDKPQLIAEAVRLVKPGGMIAFTDWIEGPAGPDRREAERLLKFMKFPNIQDLDGYVAAAGRQRLRGPHGRRHRPVRSLRGSVPEHAQHAVDLRRAADHRLRRALMESLGAEMNFMRDLAHAGKIAQGLFVARKTRSTDPQVNAFADCNSKTGGNGRSCDCQKRLPRPVAARRPRASHRLRRQARPTIQLLVRRDDRALPGIRTGGKGGGPADRRHPVRVHAARADHGGRRRAGLPVRRLGRDDSRPPGASAGQSLPADQVDLRLSRPAEQSVSGNGRPGGGRDHLRRQEEDVRTDGRDRGRCTCWNCRRRSTTPTPWRIGVGELEKFRAFLDERFGVEITDE